MNKSRYDRERYLLNREARIAASVAWARANPKKKLGYERKRLYGLTQDRFLEILSTQGNKCAICCEAFLKEPHVDHCHDTGKVRSLLCGPCNRQVGIVEKYGGRLAAYLRKHNG